MDRRELRKLITWWSLEKVTGSEWDEIAVVIFDKNESDLTEAEKNRWTDLLQEMVENAESKLK